MSAESVTLFRLSCTLLPMSNSAYYQGSLENYEAADAICSRIGSLLSADNCRVEIIVVPAGIEVSDPISIAVSGGASHQCIFVQKGSKATITEEISIESNCTRHTEIFLEDDAQLTFLSLQKGSAENVHIKQRSSIGADAHMYWQNITLGDGTIFQDLESTVEGARGTTDIDWVFYGKKKEKQHLSAQNFFHAPDGRGEILMKGVAEDTAHVQCNGMINIGLQGGGTDTYLTEDVLMLDPSAQVDAIPGLEIKTNDVKASHSATVSRVTDEDLFYFASRGIDKSEARKMYVEGFLGDITSRISDGLIRDTILTAVHEKYVG